MAKLRTSKYPVPPVRRLRVYAFDPQASVSLSTAVINDATIKLPWETRWETALGKGPTNEYIEVIDVDPASGLFYEPVDLNDPLLLAQDGLAPSEGRPQFHQQMVFAVAMRTIRSFERALGRPVLWARDKALCRDRDAGNLSESELNFTRTLRIYPHAIPVQNAYYSPEKRALLFGYFRPEGAGARATDANWVFTCLSQDIIAHETTHAILHGMQQRSLEPSNIDALAFHEAFADIVALFQHFDAHDVVAHLLARSGGSLRTPSLLTGLAAQFGTATGKKGALRYALIDLLREEANIKALGKTKRDDKPDDQPDAAALLAATREVHARGGYLVAAVFDAFVTIFETRSTDLFRLAGYDRGSPDLPALLVDRLADEASRAADQVLRMCVRALDYVPPVDLCFGEYLRAIVTADLDLVPDDPMRYRVAFCEAFRKWGIRVPGCLSMAPDSLLWDGPDFTDFDEDKDVRTYLKKNALGDSVENAVNANLGDLLGKLQLGVTFSGDVDAKSNGKRIVAGRVGFNDSDFRLTANGAGDDEPVRNLRDMAMRIVVYNQDMIHRWFNSISEIDGVWDGLLGLRLQSEVDGHPPALGSLTFKCDPTKAGSSEPVFQVNSARISRRIGPDGTELHLLIVQLTQRRRAYFDPAEQKAADAGDYSEIGDLRRDRPDFWFRGGATLHVDLRDGKLLRIIRKSITNEARLAEEVAFRTGDETGVVSAITHGSEPFAFMHLADPNDGGDTGDETGVVSAITHGSEPFAFMHPADPNDGGDQPAGVLASSAAPAAPPGTGNSTPPTSVSVRMYRALDPAPKGDGTDFQGLLGDCFLIRLATGDAKSHIMIDCGLLLGSPDAEARAKRIAADIIDTCDGKLDLLVVTHEHWDHISGFAQAEEIFFDESRLSIDNLWMAWTEDLGDPSKGIEPDPDAKALRAKVDASGQAFAMIAERLQNEPIAGLDVGRALSGLEGFLGLAGPGGRKGRLKGRDIFDRLKQGSKSQHYLAPTKADGKASENVRFTPGDVSLRAYVLGPPRDLKRLSKDKPSTAPGKQETYLETPTLGSALLDFADDADLLAQGESRFAPQYCRRKLNDFTDANAGKLPPDDADTMWLRERYFGAGFDLDGLDDAAAAEAMKVRQGIADRRRIDGEWLATAGALALKLDSDTNNTSLVLAFDLPDGTAMLFAADAQVGNWESWHDQTYLDEQGVAHSATSILNRVRFYKVGHHGSHNATLAQRGLALMTRDDLVAAIPTDEQLGARQGRGGWQMPNIRVNKALLDRTDKRILRNDRWYKDPDKPNKYEELGNAEASFIDNITETDLYLEYKIL